MKISVQVFIASLILLITLQSALADVFSYGKSKTVIGSLQTHTVKNEESLVEIARQFDLGYQEIVDANPEFDPFVPGKDAFIQIPTSWVLPDVTPYEGIVINLSEMRLFYFFKQKSSTLVMTLPTGARERRHHRAAGRHALESLPGKAARAGRPGARRAQGRLGAFAQVMAGSERARKPVASGTRAGVPGTGKPRSPGARGKPSRRYRHNVYVIELDPHVLNLARFRAANPERDMLKPCVYVGMTGLTPEERFAKHKAGIRANSYVQRFGVRLLPGLYVYANPIPYEAAREMEVELAIALREEGYAVWQA